MGLHRKEKLILKMFFQLHINGGAQEGKFNFVKNFFNGIINGSTQEKKY